MRIGALALAGSALGHMASAHAGSQPDRELATMTIVELSRLLASRKLTSRRLVEQSLAAIKDPEGEGARTFLLVHEREALAAADRVDAERRSGVKLHALAGIPISIKDLFDEAGVVTLGGSRVLLGAPPAKRDSTVVERLRKAGAVIIGRTNLTEFAYSGLGINPHYGTPKNTFDRSTGRIPGGSTSGGAISVTDAMVAGAIGTDTGGSVRIPAALNGLVGFKPTAHRVPRDGVLPLSHTLDSVGPIARTVADCALLDHVLAAETGSAPRSSRPRGLRFAVPKTVFQDDLSPAVANAFSAALGRLSVAGATIVELPMAEFAQAAAISPRGALASAEAFVWHLQWLKDGADKYDPRVLVRIRPGEKITAKNYNELLQLREGFIRTINALASGFDAMLMPTTPDTAPTIAETSKDDESYFRLNGRMLRNPSIVNLFDGCALTVPCHDPGAAPVGLMIAGTQNTDRRILAIGLAVEEVVWKRRG
ncbi:MAG: aspartyl-tRNA(Asn)/glutamyl-tRNA(Gln) amidotransferase subunit [Blastocatellia bacterium]|nr:aspartyl-tRNA(Asn)/glutamyl-tRNA(Gln) amidotransferase subunit [Blastocatellia bacterium]